MQQAVASSTAAASAPWRDVLKKALSSNARIRNSIYLQLATVRPDGRPANRTVVYRGFMDQTDRPTFVTDARSRKVDEIAHCPWAEVAWYFPQTREQFRMLGKLTLVSAQGGSEQEQKARVAAWKKMSDAGRQQFSWPQQGEPRAADSAFELPAPSADDPVSDTFCLIYMDVEEVDHLHLKKNRRVVYRRRQAAGAGEDGGGGGGGGSEWEVADVNP